MTQKALVRRRPKRGLELRLAQVSRKVNEENRAILLGGRSTSDWLGGESCSRSVGLFCETRTCCVHVSIRTQEKETTTTTTTTSGGNLADIVCV